MEYRLAVQQDAALLCRFVDDQQTKYQPEQIIAFLQQDNAKAFLAVDREVVAFAYGCVLHRPDGKQDFYLHAIDVAEEFQGRGYGTELVRFIDGWRKSAGYRKMFLVTNKSNGKACRCYDKAGGTAPSEDDVVYVF